MSASADLLLHPVRLRIVQSFLGEHELTTTDLRRKLADVATATLYRHVAVLVRGDVLTVTAERKVRGAVERTYRLRAGQASLRPEDLSSTEEHRAAFTAFVAGLLADFDRYLAADDIDFARELVGYRQAGFYATDQELTQVIATINDAIRPLVSTGPGAGRTRRLLTTVLLPASSAADQPGARS